jgi:hypothetical protein
MTADDLASTTGCVRYSKQVEWFKRELRVDVVRRSDGSPVITWETFEALQKKRAGVLAAPVEEQRPALRALRAIK